MAEGEGGAAPTGGGEGGAPVDGGQPQGAPVDGGQQGGAPAQQTDWTAGLSEETRGFVANRNWKSPEDLVTSYRNLESLRGVPEDRLVKLPQGDDPDSWGQVFEKLGRPGEPDGYEVELPDSTPAETATWLKNAMHKSGLTQQQAQTLAAELSQRLETKVSERQAEQQLRTQQELDALRQEWGAAYEQNWQQVDRAASSLGMGEDELHALKDAWGPAQAARFIHSLGEKLGEDTFAGGNQGGEFGAMAPAQASARIADLKADADFRGRLLNGDKAAQEQWDRLHRWAYGKQ